MLSSVGLPLITVATNAWDVRPHIQLPFPALGLAAALHTVSGGYGAGLISSSTSYREQVLPMNSSQLSDPLLGGASFEIVHSGAAFTRMDKIDHLSRWPEAVANLRVCLDDPRFDRNCGRCRKCLLTYAGFRVTGVEPTCFDPTPSDEAVLRWARRFSSHPVFVADMRSIIEAAEARGLDEPWVRAARRRLRVITAHKAAAILAPNLSGRAARLLRRVVR
jgi:hypothetical protein